MRQACGAIAMVMAVMAVVDAGAARADRTMVGIGETIGDYLGAASGGSGGRVVVGRTIGEGDGVRIGAEYDLTKLGDGLSHRFATGVRWTPDRLATHADPGAVAGAYLEVGVGRQIAGVGARTDAEVGLGLHVASVIDGGHLLDQIFGVSVIVAPAWARDDAGARCLDGCPAARAALDVGIYFTSETSL